MIINVGYIEITAKTILSKGCKIDEGAILLTQDLSSAYI